MKLRLNELLAERGLTQSAFADAVEVKKGFVSEIISGKKQPSVKTLGKMAEVLGVEIPDLFIKNVSSIPVLGIVGAGEVIAIDGQGGTPLYELPCPAQLRPDGLAAVEVRGTSMLPAIAPGSVLFYRRAHAEGVPVEALGRVCIAQTDDGNVWAKQVKAGDQPDLFHLISINPQADNLLNRTLHWATPVLLVLPPELVKT